MAEAIRHDGYLTATFRHYLLHNDQPKADPIAVHLGCSVQLPKFWEKFGQIAAFYPSARVSHVHHEKLVAFLVSHLDFNAAVASELERVFDQVNQNLFKSPLVTNQSGQLILIYFHFSLTLWKQEQLRRRLKWAVFATCSLMISLLLLMEVCRWA